MALEPGQIVEGKYRITRLLGEGGMGAVYECENTAISKKFAIKVLHASVAENKDAVSRFEKEAQAAGRIGSDHITEVMDLGTLPNGDRFMVMEYLDGSTLSKRIKDRGRLTPAEIGPVMVQLLEGLTAAHQAGIIHRDLKPDNVFLLRSKAGRKDFVKVLDFGISKFNQLAGDSAMSMTRTGAVMGTPYYMSPEQAKGSKEIDGRSDLYSAGVILYEAITGQVPFNADTFNELIFKIVLEAPPPPTTFVPDLDPAFGAIINKAMAREPAHRFQTAGEFQQAIIGFLEGSNIPLFEESTTHAAARGTLASIAQTGGPAVQPHTPGPWTDGGTAGGTATTTAPKKSNAGVLALLAVFGLVVLGAGGLAVAKLAGGKGQQGLAAEGETPPAATSAPVAAATSAPVAAAATSAPAAVTAPPAASVDPPAAASAAAAGSAAPSGGSKTAGGTGKAPAAGAGAAQQPKGGATGAAGGRKIRTEL